MSDQPNPDGKIEKPKIEGSPVPLDELLAMADITEEDIIAAQEWWNAHASKEWKGALDDGEG